MLAPKKSTTMPGDGPDCLPAATSAFPATFTLPSSASVFERTAGNHMEPLGLAALDGEYEQDLPSRWEMTPGDRLRFAARVWSGAMWLNLTLGIGLALFILCATWKTDSDMEGAFGAFLCALWAVIGSFICNDRARRLRMMARGIK